MMFATTLKNNVRNLMVAVLISFVISSSFALTKAADTQKQSDSMKLATYIKPAIVRIADGLDSNWVFYDPQTGQAKYKVEGVHNIGLGSGFFVNPNGYIVTNAHVVDGTKTFLDAGGSLSAAKKILFPYYVYKLTGKTAKELSNDVLQMIWNNSEIKEATHYHHVLLQNGENMMFSIVKSGAVTGEGKDVAVIKIEVKNAPTLLLGDSESVKLQEHLTVAGYPGSGDSRVLNVKSSREATIDSATVTSTNKQTDDGTPILQISSPSVNHGSSGGPMINDEGKVVGLVTFGGNRVNGQEVPGVGFAFTSNTIKEFMNQSGCENVQGPGDKLYREGLELYWDGYYSHAIEKFEAVKRLTPLYAEVDELIRDCAMKGQSSSSSTKWIVIGIVVVVILGIGFFFIVTFSVGGALLIRRHNKKNRMTQPTVVMPNPTSQQTPRPITQPFNINPTRTPSAA
jgi:S1-C subfamily serine protease